MDTMDGISIFVCSHPDSSRSVAGASSVHVAYNHQANMAFTIIHSLTAACVKTALLLLYLRIFRPCRKANIMIWAGIAFVVLFYLASVVAYLLLFVPYSGGDEAWALKSARNDMALLDVNATQGIIGTIQDLYILVIPIHMVAELHLARRRKLGVMALFLTGLLYVLPHKYYPWRRN
jgi:hypothetical protein